MDDTSRRLTELQPAKHALVSDLARVAARDRWGVALIAVGWVHLVFFLVCQAFYSSGDRASTHFLAFWLLEFVTVVWVLRRIAGRGWFRATPMAAIVMRVWITFLILSFNVASLNTLTGFALDWFKPVWATLSTFGFAVLAYLLTRWFFLPAVQMYFTGLLMVWKPEWNYMIYGFSWWIALQAIGVTLERKRGRALAQRDVEQLLSETLSRPTVRLSALGRERSGREVINWSGCHPQPPGGCHSRSRGRTAGLLSKFVSSPLSRS